MRKDRRSGMKKQSKGYEIDMCNGPLASKMLLFALPLMASSLLQLLFNAADVVVVGRFCGKASLAAVGSNTALVNLMINLFVGLSVGANVVVAQDLGAGRKAHANRAVHTAILLAMVSGVALMAFGAVMARQMLEWMSSPESVIGLATLYLRIYFIGMPANMVYNFGSAILRSKGDTKRPLYFLMIAGVINVLLNLFFVVVCRWDVAGVAAATSISQYVSAAMILRCLTREHGALHLNLHRMHFDKAVIKRIFQVGLPAGFQGVVFALSNVVIQSSINSFGDTVMAGSAAAQNIEGFVYVSMNAFYQTALTFTGQNYGAAKCRRVDRVALYCLGFVLLTGLALGNLVYYFGHPLVGVYAPGEEEVIRQGLVRLSYIGRLYAICGIMDTMVGILRGLGYSVIPMVVSLLGSCALRLLWVWFIFPLDQTPANLYISYPITWAVTGAVHLLMFLLIRKKAYAHVQGAGPSYLAVDGRHPEMESGEKKSGAV